MSLRDYLEGVRECVLQGWTQRVCARDEHGNSCTIFEQRAMCFCLGGAMQRMSNDTDEYYEARKLLNKSVHPDCIPSFNDSHTQAEVIQMLDRVIEVCP